MDFGIQQGIAVVVIGFGMVFVILCVISFVLSIFSFVYKIKEKNKIKNMNTEIETKFANEEKEDYSQQTDNSELVAVITAAIAASESTASDKIIVHSIRKVSNWNKTAISENHKGYY